LAEAQPIVLCGCGTELPPQRLACPICQRLVHAETLGRQLREAGRLEAAGDVRGELAAVRGSLDLLPAGSRQHAVLSDRASRLSDRIDSGGVAAMPPEPASISQDRWRVAWKVGSAAGALALLGWKLKFVLVFVATKAKLLVLGLGKATTLFSMLLSLGLYWSLWGVWFALGLVLSIYVHEMGHVSALRRFGIKASAPMFIPGLGAFVRMKQYPHTVREDARIGLAGPVWGLAAAVAVLLAYGMVGHPLLAAVATVGAWINLFNLIPAWTLDGGRGFRALSRPQRWVAVTVIAGVWAVTQEGLLVLLFIAAVWQAFAKAAPPPGDDRALLTYASLVVALSALATVPVPT